MIVIGDIEHGRMIARKADVGFDPEIDKVMARVNERYELMGGVIFTNYTRRAIHMHTAGAGPGWLCRELCWLVFDYVFNQLHVKYVLATVASTKPEVLDMVKRMGFVELLRIPDIVMGGDMVVLSMVRDQCIWLKFRARYMPGKPEELVA
jgi:hypothetical protein